MRDTKLFQELYPLTNAQKSIWVADNLYPHTSQANLAATATIHEYVDIKLMNKAINLVIKQNDALRIRIVNSDGTPRQYFAEFEYREFDTLDFSYENGEEDFKQWVKDKTEKPFALIDSELCYFAIIKLSDKTVCFLNFHHMIVDAWGVVLVIRKMLQEYWFLKNGVDRDDAVEPSFIDHINTELKFVGSERFAKQRDFWSSVFQTVPEFIEMHPDKGLHSLKAQRKSYVLPSDLSLKLQNFCTIHEVSSFSVFYALLALYLFKKTSKKDIVIGTPVLNRSGNIEKNTVGMFMHNIPTRIYVEPSLDFPAFVNESFRELKKYLRNQRYPYSNILKDFRERHQFSGTLMDVTLNFHNARFDSVIDYEGIWHYSGAQPNSLSLSVSDRAGTGMPILDYDYLLEAFDETEIDQMHASLCNLLTEALDHPGKKLSELSILFRTELNMILKGFNQTELIYDTKTVTELFETEVSKSPEKTALICEGKSLSYAELNHKANQLARYLRTRGVGRNTIVGLLVKRSLEMVVGILGILKAGAAYLPVDPSYPESRIAYIFKQSGVKLTLTNIEHVAEDFKCEFENISFANKTIYESFSGTNLEQTAEANDLAYVLYTSGSTGNPKGVMVQHGALCNLIHGIAQALDLGGKTILSLTTISFDIFFLETILPLARGMRVVIANEDEQVIPKLVLSLISKYQVDVLQATPSKMKLILDEGRGQKALTHLSYILIGGEEFPGALLPQLEQTTHAEIFNMYGPTETTVWSTMKKLTSNEKITIGKPIANTQIYVLDEYLAPVPIGSVGEIFIAGDGVSLGYLHHPELTLERFLDNPFNPGTKMYKTGDLGRWLSNGEIEFLGRNDNQVKIRGFRIELGEIEARLADHALINEAVVAVRTDKTGKKHLCAYITGNEKISDEELKSHLLKSLPSYMIPAWFMWLDHLPLTPNGKVDRKSLSGLMELPDRQEAGIYAAPRNDIELKLASLWAEALQRDKVGIDDNLFALGGDSLTILEIMSGALSEGWKLSAQDFYECPTIRDLAAKIATGREVANFTQEEIFHNKWELDVEYDLKPMDIGNVLLTGATGFLGIHLLKELLEQSNSQIYCLVRGSNVQQRLHDLINFYYPSFPHAYLKRIKVLSGDITAKNFGLTEDGYYSLAEQVETVIHSAALVDHYGRYADFAKINVEGTGEIINFCLKFNKKLNHISTVSISGNFKIDYNKSGVVFRENDFFIGQDYRSNVYVQSKFEAENQIFKAQRQGLRASIFRVGILTGRYSDGQFQINIEKNAFYRKLKSLFSLRVVPVSFTGQSLELTPVDYCAQAIVNLIRVNQNDGLVFHVFNDEKITTNQFLRILENLDIKIETLEDADFNIYINNLSRTKEGKETLSGIVSDLVLNDQLNYGNTVVVDSTFTKNYLHKLGFAWPIIDEKYLTKIIMYMDKVKFISKVI